MNRLIQADCLEILKALPDKSIDLLCTDPPYGIGIAKSGVIGDGRYTPKNWDAAIPTAEHFRQMLRVSKQQIIWGGNYFAHLLPASRCWLAWWKKDGLPRLTFADCELAWTSFRQPAQVYNCRWHGLIRDSKECKVGHPTQKALQVMKWCIREFSREGDLVLDPFAGSGTTLIAASQLGRQFLGIERDGEYLEIANQRLLAAKEA
jgi:site-specific DNA-methyltransferase (adenine-specific)